MKNNHLIRKKAIKKETKKETNTDTDWERRARDFIAQHWSSPDGLAHPAAFHRASERWYRALAVQGWSVAHWPKLHGGANWPRARLYRWQMLCQQAQTPPINTLAMSLIAPLLMEAVRAGQTSLPLGNRLLSEIGAFEAHWCLGLLEPVNAKILEATRLVTDGNDYVLNGSKRALADGLLVSTESLRTGLWPERILCLALDSDDQWRVCVVPMALAGVSMAPVPNQRGRWFHVTFDNVSLQAQEILSVPADGLLAALAGFPALDSAVLPGASSHGLGAQLALLKRQLRANPHEDTHGLLSQLNDAEVALEGLRALEARTLAPLSPQFPQPLPMTMLNLKSQELEQKIGTLQLVSLGYYALAKTDELKDHNQGPINPAGDSAIMLSQALSALAASHYGWNPRDVLARQWLNIDSKA